VEGITLLFKTKHLILPPAAMVVSEAGAGDLLTRRAVICWQRNCCQQIDVILKSIYLSRRAGNGIIANLVTDPIRAQTW
jgi:hypothetical protein